jgi:hypothetical protein
MQDSPTQHTYEQTLVSIHREHAANVARSHYNPWRLGLYVTLSLAAPIIAGVGGFFTTGWLLAAVAAFLAIPLPVFVVLWAIDAGLVEHERLKHEKLSMSAGPALPRPAAPAVETKLRPGLLQNGKVVPAAPVLSPDLAHLRDVCVQLVRLGSERGTWARSALAEGPDAPMTGEDWDLASPQLQDLGFFWVKPGRGGGLQPVKGKEIAETIARLEAAR